MNANISITRKGNTIVSVTRENVTAPWSEIVAAAILEPQGAYPEIRHEAERIRDEEVARDAEITRRAAMEEHRGEHYVSASQDYPFYSSVNLAHENQAAHGNICRVETCSCGARRATNINGHHIEVGYWG